MEATGSYAPSIDLAKQTLDRSSPSAMEATGSYVPSIDLAKQTLDRSSPSAMEATGSYVPSAEKEAMLAGWKPEYRPSPSAEDITKRHVIILVEEIERAYQYFDLKDFFLEQELFHLDHCVPVEFIDIIVDLIDADDNFKMLDTNMIRHALMIVDWELRFKHHFTDAPSDNDEMMTAANKLERVQLMEEIFKKVERHDDDYYLSANLVFALVHEIQNTDRVLHQKPEEELKILKKKHHACYYNNFISVERQHKAKTVTFAYDGCDASHEDIKTLFSALGEIITVHSSSLGERLHLAHVTFKDLTTANNAICLAARSNLQLNGGQVSTLLTSYNKPASDLPPSMLQYTADAMSALENMEDELLAKARNRYAVLVEKANGRKMDKRKMDSAGDLESVLPDDM